MKLREGKIFLMCWKYSHQFSSIQPLRYFQKLSFSKWANYIFKENLEQDIKKQIGKNENLLTNNSLLVVRELPDVRDDPEQKVKTCIVQALHQPQMNNCCILVGCHKHYYSLFVDHSTNMLIYHEYVQVIITDWCQFMNKALTSSTRVDLGVWQQMKVTTMQRRMRKMLNYFITIAPTC